MKDKKSGSPVSSLAVAGSPVSSSPASSLAVAGSPVSCLAEIGAIYNRADLILCLVSLECNTTVKSEQLVCHAEGFARSTTIQVKHEKGSKLLVILSALI